MPGCGGSPSSFPWRCWRRWSQCKPGAKGSSLVFDPARLAGLAAAVLALMLRAPFLVVILAAAGTAAGLRLAGIGEGRRGGPRGPGRAGRLARGAAIKKM